MKKALIIIISALAVAGCMDAGKTPAMSPEESQKVLSDTSNFTTIQWIDSMDKNMGKVTEGEQVLVTYKFKNTGTKPLIITSVSASCGCTIPETPREPIAPGAESEIKAKFNSASRTGQNHKQVYVTANTSPEKSMKLGFTVEVAPKAKEGS